MFTCRGGHLRIYQQRKSWGKIEAEHFAYLHANFSHGVQKMLFALGELLPFRRACENFAPSAKSSWWFLKNSSSRSLTSHPMRKNTGYANPLWNPFVSFLKTIALGLQIRTLCEFPQGLRTQSSPYESSLQTIFFAYPLCEIPLCEISPLYENSILRKLHFVKTPLCE